MLIEYKIKVRIITAWPSAKLIPGGIFTFDENTTIL